MKNVFSVVIFLLFPLCCFSQLTLPRGVTVFVMKTGDQPAKIIVVRQGRQLDYSETEIEKTPTEVRPYLEAMFKEISVTRQPLEIVYTIDPSVENVPGVEAWAKKAVELCRAWHPRLEEYLATEGFIPSRKIEIVFQKMDGVAYSSRNRIVISTDWIASHPDDWGMVIHELVHIIQGYRNGGPGWVTEGIADYIRHAQFEPDVPMRSFDPDRAKYTDAYQITAAFFMWLEKSKCPDLVTKLNRLMRDGSYSDSFFQLACGVDLDTLWDQYIAEVKKRRAERD